MDRIQKFLLRLDAKERAVLMKILEDILQLRLSRYDVKALKGYKGFSRLRKGSIRIIFAKQNNRGTIVDIAFRKDAYR